MAKDLNPTPNTPEPTVSPTPEEGQNVAALEKAEAELAELRETAANLQTSEKEAKEQLAALQKEMAEAKGVDPLTVGRKFKQVGNFVVQEGFEPSLTPDYKKMQDELLSKLATLEESRGKVEAATADLQEQLKTIAEGREEERSNARQEADRLEAQIAIASKEVAVTRGELLRYQIAIQMGAPLHLLQYARGDTAEEIEASLKQVLVDFKASGETMSKEEHDAALQAAIERTRDETKAALTGSGPATPPGQHGTTTKHTYTREEIASMDGETYKANREEILRQQNEGLIK